MTRRTKPDAPPTDGNTRQAASIAAQPGAARGELTQASAWSLMPKDRKAQGVLQQRARLLAASPETQRAQASHRYVRFRLGPAELYGIPYAHLEEIICCADVTRVPCTPPAIAGVTNYRGELLTLLDLKQFFHTDAAPPGADTQAIVVHAGRALCGLVVDDIEGDAEYAADSLDPPLSSGGVSNLDHVLGVHQGQVTILNIAALLDDPALLINETVA